jgi:hypothetical protein
MANSTFPETLGQVEALRENFWERLLAPGELPAAQAQLLGLRQISQQLAAIQAALSGLPAGTSTPATAPVVLPSPFSFTDLVELMAAGGASLNVEPQELPIVTIVAAGTSVTTTLDIPPNRVLVIGRHTLYANPASNAFLLSLILNGVPLFSSMPMSQPELRLDGGFLGAVTSSIAWTLDNTQGQAQVAFTEHLEGVYLDAYVWETQILPAILVSARAALRQGGVGQ